MSSVVENESNLNRELKLSVPVAKLNDQINSRINELGKTLKVPGFRSGKVPAHYVKQKYYTQVHAEITEKLVREAVEDELAKKHLKPIYTPKVDIVSDGKENKPFEFTAKFEIYPNIPKIDVSDFTINLKEATVEVTDIEKQLLNLRKSRSEWKEVKQPVQEGMRVTCKSTCMVDDKKVDAFSRDNMIFVPGEAKQLLKINEGLLKKTLNEQVTLSDTLPESEYDWSQKEATFTLEIIKVEKAKVPEINEAFCKSFGVESGQQNDLNTRIEESLKEEGQRLAKLEAKQEIFEALVKKYDIELPESMLDLERKNECSRLGYKSFDELSNEKKTELEKKIMESVKLGLLVGEFVNQQKIEADNEKIYQKVNSVVNMYGGTKDIAEKVVNNAQLMAKIRAEVLEDSALDKMLSLVSLKKSSILYADLVKEY